MKSVYVELGAKSYTIEIATGLVDQIGSKLRALLPQAETAVIITDSNVGPLYGERLRCSLCQSGFQTTTLTFAAGEQSKNLATLSRLYTGLARAGVTRSDVIVALGGGVTGDMAGLAAATFLRGVAFVQVPTSLLAMVDSSVGGKVAVDLPEGKNLVGAFYQPRAVYIDTLVLQTLPERFFYDGMAEVIKYGCIKDLALFIKLEELPEIVQSGEEKVLAQAVNVPILSLTPTMITELPEIVASCCNIKARIVEKDEFDTGERMVLNFGHTLGHAVERAYHYLTYSHGEAVAVGMMAFTKRSEKLGLTEAGTSARLEKLLRKYHLPVKAEISEVDFQAAVQLDKKKKGHTLTIVLLQKIGTSFLQQLDFKELKEFK